ncbi:hypothetical protein ICE98_02452 [Lactococcus lactis]|nr:hypothetical protein [Lactococcus lactis]
MLVIAAYGFLISLLTFIVLLIEKITKNKNRLTLVGLMCTPKVRLFIQVEILGFF